VNFPLCTKTEACTKTCKELVSWLSFAFPVAKREVSSISHNREEITKGNETGYRMSEKNGRRLAAEEIWITVNKSIGLNLF
jgi:hypothetical protein